MDSNDQGTSLWFLITALCVGGAERTLVDLANAVDGDQYDVTVWTIFDTNPLATELEADITVRSLTDCGRVENGSVVAATNRLAYVTVPLKFCYAAATERPAIVQSFLTFDNVIAGLAGLVSPATVITGIRSVPNEQRAVRAALDRLSIAMADHVVSNSEAGKAFAVERGGAPERVSVVRNGRDADRFQSADADAVESELGIDENEIVVGTIGRLLERKGHYELVGAWERVIDRGFDARLVFVGDGQDREAIQTHAADLGCADTIEFLGTREDVPELLAAMDVFAFPSHFEGLPGAVIEAMLAARPIVATPVDGTGELLDGYRTGLFVPVEDPDTLAWAIMRLFECPSLRNRLGESAREEARSEFTVDAMVDGFEAVYEAVTTGGESPGPEGPAELSLSGEHHGNGHSEQRRAIR